MVRLDKCVEALYDSVTADNRTKNLQILTVMKGAISMSRSKTGECIFRTNKTEKKNLERLIKIEGKNSHYNISQIDTHRKQVMSRWSKVLENQTSCSSQALFEELLEIDDINDLDKGGRIVNHGSPEPKDYKLKHLVDLRLANLENENNTNGFATVMASRRRQFNTEYQELEQSAEANNEQTQAEFITERKQIRGKYAGDVSHQELTSSGEHGAKIHGAVLAKTRSTHLPSIGGESVSAPSKTKTDVSMPPTLERDLTDWGNWSLKDKSWIVGYLHREKTRHEDLIIRNALNKIETEMSGANVIKRQQLRQKLQNERQQREAEERQLRQKLQNERQQREAEERHRERLRTGAEVMQMSGTAIMVSSDKLEGSSESPKLTCTSPALKKRVAFKEPSSDTECETKKRTPFSVVKSNRSKRRYKPIQTSKCSLPVISEGNAIVKMTQNG